MDHICPTETITVSPQTLPIENTGFFSYLWISPSKEEKKETPAPETPKMLVKKSKRDVEVIYTQQYGNILIKVLKGTVL